MTSIKSQTTSEELIKNIIQSRRPDFKLSCSVGNNKETAIQINEIKFIESNGTISKFHFNDTEKVSSNIAHTIGECEDLLKTYGFVRVHRTFLVNCSYIESMTWQREGTLHMYCGRILPMSRRRKNDINEYMEKVGLIDLLDS